MARDFVSDGGGPGGPGGPAEGPRTPPAREPAFNAPWPALLIPVTILGLYAVQSLSGAQEALLMRYGFSPRALAQHQYWGLATALFVHGGWTHALLNGLGGLAFGAPVARLLGPRIRGVVLFFLFYIGTGVLSNLGYAAIHPNAAVLLIGASGAVSGLMGAASRLIDRRAAWLNGGLAPFRNPTVISMALAWVLINGLAALFGFGVITGDSPIAWEAHLVGYAAGLLLIGPLWRLAPDRFRIQ
jgi:membrane associated rhomboid family serine protease